MHKRLKTVAGAAAALAALALGGSALASATSGTQSTVAKHGVKRAPASSAERTTPDTDTIQSGDQTSPDNGTATSAEKTTPDTDTIQSGDQTSPDNGTATSAEKTTESSSESSPGDGPGGHEDPPGNVDFQSEAAE